MNRLFRFELRRMFRSKLIYIITGIFTFFTIINALSTAMSCRELGLTMTFQSLVTGTFNTFFYIYCIFLAAWIAPCFFCSDYSPGSVMPNVISHGYSRTKVFLAKYMAFLVFHVFMFVVPFIVGILTGCVFVDDFSTFNFSANQLHTLINILFSGFATMSLHVFISVVCKMRLSIVIGIFVSNPFVALIVCALPSLKPKFTDVSSFIMGWYPPFAYMKVFLSNVAQSMGLAQYIKIDFSHLILSSIILFALSFGGSLLITRRKEISK